MSQIDVSPLGPHEFEVQVTEGDRTTSHRVTVPSSIRDRLGLADADEERAVRESFAFLLEREPATSILDEFSLDVISGYFPEYEEELARRIG
ncbi:MAG: hypothetical protein ABR540_10505 [Acidimicrobiales bacterium]